MPGEARREGDEVVVSPAEAGDALEIAEVYLASKADALPYLPTVHSDDETRSWIAEVLLPRCKVFVARQAGVIVGFLALNGSEVEQLYLRPGWYRRGLGSRLLDLAKRESPGRLELWAFQRNHRARAFYEAHGFQVIALTNGADNEEHEPDVRYAWERPPSD